MLIAAAPHITLIFAAALALINIWLGARVILVRRSRGISLGHGDVPGMEARIRAHGNFNEYVPIALILMALVEMQVGTSRGLWAIGALLVVARVLHPTGMDRRTPNNYRIFGMILTFAATLALVVWAILLAYRVRL